MLKVLRRNSGVSLTLAARDDFSEQFLQIAYLAGQVIICGLQFTVALLQLVCFIEEQFEFSLLLHAIPGSRGFVLLFLAETFLFGLCDPSAGLGSGSLCSCSRLTSPTTRSSLLRCGRFGIEGVVHVEDDGWHQNHWCLFDCLRLRCLTLFGWWQQSLAYFCQLVNKLVLFDAFCKIDVGISAMHNWK